MFASLRSSCRDADAVAVLVPLVPHFDTEITPKDRRKSTLSGT